jgi:diguanylate cyclase (GGDEF)-like protein
MTPAGLNGTLIMWAAAYMLTSMFTAYMRYKSPSVYWRYRLLFLAIDVLLVLRVFTVAGSLEGYIAFAYLFLLVSSGHHLGIEGAAVTGTLITVFDNLYVSAQVGAPYLFSPMPLRLGLVWFCAIYFGLTSKSMNITLTKTKLLNEQLDNKVAALISTSRILRSINDSEKLKQYLREIIGRVFEISEYALIVAPTNQIEPIVIVSSGINEARLVESYYMFKKEILSAGTEFDGLGLTVANTEKGTQGSYVLLLDRDGVKSVEKDPDVFYTVFSQFILAIDNGLLMQKLRSAALTDHLTGLYNQRYFYNRMGVEIKRAQRNSNNVSLLLIDVDDFKQYNDSYGHLAGDQVLSKIAGIISRSCRESDVAARYGGEEFVLILPDTGSEGAIEIGERIVGIVGQERFRGRGTRDFKMTVSIGAVTYPNHGLDATDMVAQANKALAAAKMNGKNRIVAAKGKRAKAVSGQAKRSSKKAGGDA